ncbi:MAG: manganese efflux pump MntP family protein [Planctomycetota bacterium]
MSELELTILAFGLAIDAFAVAVGTSIALAGVTPRQVFRLGFHFGLFQALMPVLGWLAGQRLGAHLATWDHWVAFALLAYVGGHAAYGAVRNGDGNGRPASPDPTRGRRLVMLSVATSLDALAAGLSLGLLGVRIWYAALVIGCVAGTLTTAGMLLGGRLGSHVGQRVGVVGGVVLIGIGVKILVQG